MTRMFRGLGVEPDRTVLPELATRRDHARSSQIEDIEFKTRNTGSRDSQFATAPDPLRLQLDDTRGGASVFER